MGAVIQGNFPKIEKDYGYKKITEKGVNTLRDLRTFLIQSPVINHDDQQMMLNMIVDMLDNEIANKYDMSV